MKSENCERDSYMFGSRKELFLLSEKKLNSVYLEALEIQDKIKKMLIDFFEEEEKLKDSKTIISKILTISVNNIRREFYEILGKYNSEYLNLISENDWNNMKDNIVKNNNIYFKYIESRTFEFVKILEEEINKRNKNIEINNK